MSIRTQALSGFRWTASVRLLSQAITWAITLLVIRLLKPADYGLLAMASVFVALMSTFAELGLAAAVVQKRDVDELLLRRVFGIVLVVHLSLAALLAASAPLIGLFYAEPRVVPVIRVLSLNFVIGAFGVVPHATLLRRMEFRNRSLIDLSGAIVTSVTTLTLALAGAGVWALVGGALLGRVWGTVGLNWLSPFLRRPDFAVKEVRSLLAFGGQLATAGLLGMLFSQLDTVICAKMLGNEMLGFYSVAISLAALPSQKTAGLVSSVAFPAFSSMQHDVRKLRENVLLGIKTLSFFAFPVSWGMSSIAPEIVDVVLGPKWTPATIPLQVFAMIIPLRIVNNFALVAAQAMGRSDITLRNTVWGLVIGPPLLILGAVWAQLVGLSLAWLIVSPVLFIGAVMRSAPVITLRATDILLAMRPAATAALIMYGAVAGTGHFVADWHAGTMQIAVLIAVGALTYCAVSFGVSRKSTLEVVDVVRSIALSKRA